MKFSTTFEDISFTIEVIRDDQYLEPANTLLAGDEKDMLLSQEIAFHQIIIQAGEEEEVSSYYLSGILLATDEDELLEELEEMLIEGEILKDIVEKLA